MNKNANKNGNFFGDILDKWYSTHNDSMDIKKKIKQEEKFYGEKQSPTINQIRQFPVKATLDLHGKNLESALYETESFISECYSAGFRKVKIIAGKGIHSEKGEAVIRPEVLFRLKNNSKVREINEQPKAKDGGSGAIIVILKENKS